MLSTSLLLLAASQLQAPKVSVNLGSRASINIQADRVGNYLYVDGVINGKSVRLVVDTGAGLNVLTWDAAKRIGIEGGSATRAVGSGGADSRAKIVNIDDFNIGGVLVKNDAAVIVDLPAQLKADGLVGFSFFRHFATTFDYDSNQLIVNDSRLFKPSRALTSTELLVVNNHPHVGGVLDGVKGLLLLDTGNNGSATIYKWFADQQDLAKKWKTGAPKVAGKGVGGFSSGRATVAPSFQLGAVPTVPSILTIDGDEKGIFADRKMCANVGAEHLRRFKFTLDYPGKKAYFERANAYSEPQRLDRSGMRVDYVDGQQVVIDVQEGSPASRVGVRVGDVLTHINGRPTADLHPIGVLAAFQAAPGTQIEVTLFAKGHSKTLKLTLEDLAIK